MVTYHNVITLYLLKELPILGEKFGILLEYFRGRLT